MKGLRESLLDHYEGKRVATFGEAGGRKRTIQITSISEREGKRLTGMGGKGRERTVGERKACGANRKTEGHDDTSRGKQHILPWKGLLGRRKKKKGEGERP